MKLSQSLMVKMQSNNLQNKYDVVLLDLMLPKVSGEDVLKHIRTQGETPVIIISTKDTDVEKAINLDLCR